AAPGFACTGRANTPKIRSAPAATPVVRLPAPRGAPMMPLSMFGAAVMLRPSGALQHDHVSLHRDGEIRCSLLCCREPELRVVGRVALVIEEVDPPVGEGDRLALPGREVDLLHIGSIYDHR